MTAGETCRAFVVSGPGLLPLPRNLVAIATDGMIRGTDASGRFVERFRYTDISEQRGSGWQIVFVQVSREVDR